MCLYDAHRSGASVLAIASACATTEFGTGYFQETNVIKLFDDCSCYNQIASTPAQLPRMAQAALQYAIQKKGVAILGLPGDVTVLHAVENVSSDKNYFSKADIRPADNELQALADLINKQKKICRYLLAGGYSSSNSGNPAYKGDRH